MSGISRRALARWAAEQLSGGQKVAEVAERLASILVETGRAGELEFLIGDINWELERRGELVTAKVTTAEPITKELLAELKNQIKKVAGARQVRLEANIDKSVLGGLRVETAGRVWDATLKRQLANLKETFSPAKLSTERAKRLKYDTSNESLGG
jgi:ATP synthase F1 delta subunit